MYLNTSRLRSRSPLTVPSCQLPPKPVHAARGHVACGRHAKGNVLLQAAASIASVARMKRRPVQRIDDIADEVHQMTLAHDGGSHRF